MIKAALLVALILPNAAVALTLDAFEGRWRGEGTLTLDAEPEQRFSCRIRLNTIDPGQSFFSGRCATAQASQSFTYMLFEQPDGTVRAENRAQGESTLPPTMQGHAEPGLLRFDGAEQSLFELRLDGATLIFRLEGTGHQGFARGAADLTRTD